MTIVGNLLGLFTSAGLLWLALLSGAAAFLAHGPEYIIGFGLLAAVFVALALALLAYMAREGGAL